MSAMTHWTCPQCREVIEGQFTACWNCQAGRPGEDEPETPADIGEQVIARDLECICCEYNLRGMPPGRRCPECGSPILHSLLDRLRDGTAEGEEDLQQLLTRVMAPIAAATSKPATVLLLTAHAWLSANEPPMEEARLVQTPADAVMRSCELFGQLAMESYGGRNQAVTALRAAKMDSPGEFAATLWALMDAGVVERPSYDPRPMFGKLDSMLRFLSRRA